MQTIIELIVSGHIKFLLHELILRYQNLKDMHITLSIQHILQYTFIALISAPLPILLLSSPLQWVNEKIQHKRYYRIVKKHFANPGTVSAEQLQDVFPDKKLNELHEIAYVLQDENSYRDN
jgi:hypothetical protein